MAKKRTGLQSDISSIFSGVPIPKKDRSSSEQPDPKKPDSRNLPKQPVPQPKAPAQPSPAPPAVQQPAQPIPVVPPAQVPPAAVPERKVSRVAKKVPRRRKEKVFASRAGASSARQKMSVALVVVLSVVLVVVLVRPFGGTRRGPVASGNTGPVAAGVSAVANAKIDWPEPGVYPTSLRDPMISGSQGEIKIQAPAVLVVTAITYSEDVRLAVVGTEMLGEGDTVLGAMIIKINPDSVEFEKDGKRWTQTVQGQDNSSK
ncbi:MAG: hypothetical protein JSW66_09240 [Phycisphaerales bacterium]|nr:MAG: hypothetical protein JSW66_09240 [Phycisphaerales bacterium]